MTASVISIATGRTWQGETLHLCHEVPGSSSCHVRRCNNECPGGATRECFSSQKTAASIDPHVPIVYGGEIVRIPHHF